ncbi:MAG: response regulator [Acidobacteriota bacterium]|nr:response regulator [Acidobacteriota bacterium]
MQSTILVVDDEVSIRAALEVLLDASGFSTATAEGPAEALQWLQEHPGCALVLTDVRMPGGNGLDLLDDISANYPETPVVMLTGVHDIDVVTTAFRQGAVDYLPKPFPREELLRVVRRALEHGRVRRQNAAYRENLEEIVSARTSRLRATMHELEKSYDITLEAMGDALDLRDAATEGHSRRVTAYTVALAREMNLPAVELRAISRGAFLHDIGKIATPDAILLKPGKLTAEETAVMREHPWRGYRIIRKIPFLKEAAEIVYAHQESFDGSGYPRGLRGEEIPLGARIFAIADTLDAMTSDRPYRSALTFAQARTEIARYSGVQFDPYIVDVFLRMSHDIWEDLREEVHHAPAAIFNAHAWRLADAALGRTLQEA